MELKDKVKLIRTVASDNGITAYDIGKNTEISLTSARNVLEEDNITYRNKTLNIILDYLENAIVGTVKPPKEYTEKYKEREVAEESLEYKRSFKDLKIDDKLNKIYKQQKNTTLFRFTN